ncbi:MAG TPA: cysteine synthase family protein [Candidatus Dojkabacteria bacterium]|nr:cysteine synthase family protein [Candidatus Dojkabacteria bacterium]
MTTTKFTPLVKIPHRNINIYAKLESYNPTGSIKYRMAKYMLEQAVKAQKLKTDYTIIEATTGNTGIAFAYLAKRNGFKMIAVMPENQTIERVKLMKNYGAEIILTPANEGPTGAINKRNELVKSIKNSWTPDQFNNKENVIAHKIGIGNELLSQLTEQNVTPDYIVHGIGTGGTLMGITQALKPKYPNVKTIAVEPEESAVLSGRRPGYHNIQGIGEGFIPTLVNTKLIDNIISVNTKEALKMVNYGINNWKISIGISSGANIVAIEKLSKLHDIRNKNVITIFADGVDRYYSIINK